LVPCDPNGLSDPYVIIKNKNSEEKYKSKTIKETLNPDWSDYKIEWKFDCLSNGELDCMVWDWDLVGTDDFEGCKCISIENLLKC